MLRTIHLTLLAFLAVVVLTPSNPANARAGDWKLIASETISLRNDTATIAIGRDLGLLSSIQLRAWGKSFYLRTISVRFANGQRQIISVYDTIEAGSGSRAFSLENNRRFISEIKLRYRQGRSRGFSRSLVEIFGKSAGRPKAPPQSTGNWSRIGTKNLTTRDTNVNIGTRGGGGRQMVIRVSRNPLSVRRVRIRFGNGDVQVVRVDSVVDDGEQIGPIDLDGEYRNVSSVRISLRRQSRRRRARIQILTKGEQRNTPNPLPAGWKSLAAKDIDLRENRFVMRVSRKLGTFNAIRIRSIVNPVRVNRIRIVFDSGQIQNVRVNQRILAGGETGNIRLTGNNRIIKEIIIRTKAQNRRRRTILSLIGLPSTPVVKKFPPLPRGWESLTDTKVDLRDDRFRLRVGTNKGTLRAIRIRNRNNSVFIRNLRIVFGNETVQTVRVNGWLKAGATTNVIPLKRGLRNIRYIVVRTRGQDRRAVTVLNVVGRVEQVAPQPPPVASADWKVLGSNRFRLRSKAIIVNIGRDKGRYSALSFRVLGRSAVVRRVVITFSSGQQKVVELGIGVHDKQLTQPIELDANGRFIDSVTFALRRKRFNSKHTTMQVLGRPVVQRSNWVSFGARRADMFRPVVETYAVGRQKGRFRTVRLQARYHGVRIYGAEITYGNGDTEQIPFAGRLRRDETTREIAISRRGRGRFVKYIQIRHKSKINFRGEGGTEVFLKR